MNFIKKPISEFKTNISGTYNKPSKCPHCGISTDAILISRNFLSLENNSYLLTATCRCTSCRKVFFFSCVYNNEPSKIAPMVCIYPNKQDVYKNEYLEKISPRFIDMYNQSLQAEHSGNLDLAAIGYRSSLEILVKDFAISELNEPEDSVAKETLCNAIGKYLKQEDLVKTADVIRILGNDYTHYKRKYPEYDFSLLKTYMEIFLKQVEVEYLIKHPPFSRQQ